MSMLFAVSGYAASWFAIVLGAFMHEATPGSGLRVQVAACVSILFAIYLEVRKVRA